ERFVVVGVIRNERVGKRARPPTIRYRGRILDVFRKGPFDRLDVLEGAVRVESQRGDLIRVESHTPSHDPTPLKRTGQVFWFVIDPRTPKKACSPARDSCRRRRRSRLSRAVS